MMEQGTVRGIAGVLIWTEASRFEAMAQFYRDQLGLVARTSKSDFINFDWNGLRLSVSVHERVRGASRDPYRIMVNLLGDDIGTLHARLALAGVALTRPPPVEGEGRRAASSLDPACHRIQRY